MHELYIGLMSGTSMDGIDAVLVDFHQGMRLCGTHTESMPASLKQALLDISQPGSNEIDRAGELDIELGRYFAEAARQLLAQAEVKADQIIAIGSHGQTIRHRPLLAHPFTLQIGDPNTIAELTGITVVADLRRRDMAAGGQGAPLVPAFHQAAFQHPDMTRIVLNLGGMANITVLPAAQPGAAVHGFDTGPANVLMDAWSQQKRGRPYDHEGQWAASGTVDELLLERLLSHPYFTRQPPKSTGREDFHLAWLLENLAASSAPEDVQATLLELTARSVADAIQKEGLPGGELILCGGGAYNLALHSRLEALLPAFRLRSSAEFGLAPTWVEATAFAWLARQCLHGLPGNLPAVTGAVGSRILGGIYPGRAGLPFISSLT